MSLNLIDSHCHLEKFQATGELEAVLKRARLAGVTRMIAVGTSSADWEIYKEMSFNNLGVIDYTVGLHPCHVDGDWESQTQQIMPFFAEKTAPVAIGEIGLDYFHLPKEPAEIEKIKAWQKEAFRMQLTFALQLDIPIVIHSREAFEDCVRLIDESGVDWQKVVFHCFPGGAREVQVLNERGGRASFTGIVTYKNAPMVREALLAQGLEKLMLETDAPFLAPVPYRGQCNEPSYVKEIAQCCADLLGIPLEALAKKVGENTRDFFRLG